ncbi:hypothetical protein Tco_0992274 [Tanacetum coccineum]|uniref:Uncharacterized protein n=1 Tax=Tanacetum coccineum TaxID=301880 RepID=A0ABQ5F1U6_9ASTR
MPTEMELTLEQTQQGVSYEVLEVDINKKTENQAKMTKLSMEWKRLVETLVSNPSESDDFSLGECNLFDIDDSYYEKSTSRLAHLAPISPEIVEVCVDDDDTDDDDDYDDDFYDCVDIEEDGGEIDLDISKIVDISLREKLVESYLLIEKINAFSLSPPIPISPIFCPSSTIPVVDLDLPLEEADVPSFSDDSMILSEYESFTFDDEPVMAEVNVFDEINTSELSYPGIGENVVLDEEEDTFTFTTRSFLPFVTYPEVLPASYSTGSEDKVFKPGFPDFGRFMVQYCGRTKQCPQFPLMVSNLLFIKKELKGQKEAKTVKKPTRNERDKKKSEETAKDQSRISRHSKKGQNNKVQGPRMTSLQSLKAHLEL